MIEGGRNPEGTFVPLDDAEMRDEIGAVQEKLATFRQATPRSPRYMKCYNVFV